MKYGFIVYGKWKPAVMEGMPESVNKEQARIKKEAEKHGMKVLMWGAPYGVSENMVVIYESEKGVENYFNFGQAVDLPYTDSRTTIVALP